MAEFNPRPKKPLAGLTLAALGVVYRDIGTSLCPAIIRVASNSADIPILDQATLGAIEYS